MKRTYLLLCSMTLCSLTLQSMDQPQCDNAVIDDINAKLSSELIKAREKEDQRGPHGMQHTLTLHFQDVSVVCKKYNMLSQCYAYTQTSKKWCNLPEYFTQLIDLNRDLSVVPVLANCQKDELSPKSPKWPKLLRNIL